MTSALDSAVVPEVAATGVVSDVNATVALDSSLIVVVDGTAIGVVSEVEATVLGTLDGEYDESELNGQ